MGSIANLVSNTPKQLSKKEASIGKEYCEEQNAGFPMFLNMEHLMQQPMNHQKGKNSSSEEKQTAASATIDKAENPVSINVENLIITEKNIVPKTSKTTDGIENRNEEKKPVLPKTVSTATEQIKASDANVLPNTDIKQPSEIPIANKPLTEIPTEGNKGLSVENLNMLNVQKNTTSDRIPSITQQPTADMQRIEKENITITKIPLPQQENVASTVKKETPTPSAVKPSISDSNPESKHDTPPLILREMRAAPLNNSSMAFDRVERDSFAKQQGRVFDHQINTSTSAATNEVGTEEIKVAEKIECPEKGIVETVSKPEQQLIVKEIAPHPVPKKLNEQIAANPTIEQPNNIEEQNTTDSKTIEKNSDNMVQEGSAFAPLRMDLRQRMNPKKTDSTTIEIKPETSSSSQSAKLTSAKPEIDVSHAKDMDERVVRFEELSKRFDKLLSSMVKQDKQAMRITIEPQNMGKVTILCREVNSKMTVEIFAENDVVKETLVRQEGAVRSLLNQSGVKLEQFDVATGGEEQARRRQKSWNAETAQQTSLKASGIGPADKGVEAVKPQQFIRTKSAVSLIA